MVTGRPRSLAWIGFGLAVLVGLGLRILLAWAYYGNYDQQSYEIVQGIVRTGGNVYAETSRYNYSPLWSFLLAGLDWAGNVLSWPDHATIRIFLTLVDALTAYVLLRVSGALAAAIFLLSPVSILITGYHGQFDNLAVLLLLVTLIAPARATWLLASAAVLVKQLVLPITLFLQPAWPYRQRILLAAAAAIVFFLSLVPYMGGGGALGIVRNVLTYGGLVGDYGITSLHPALAQPGAAFFLRLLLIGAFLLMAARPPKEPIRALLLAMLLFPVLTPGFGTQYFMLPIALGAVTRGRMFWLYTAVCTWHLLGSPVNLMLVPETSPNVVWIAAIGWLGAEMMRPQPIGKVVSAGRPGPAQAATG